MEQKYWSVLLIVLVIAGDCDAMSVAQLRKTGNMLRKQCMGKVGVEEDKISDIENGIFIEEYEVMCYTACIYQLTQVVKNNKWNFDSAMKQADLMYPPEMKDIVKGSIVHCKDVSKKYKDLCEACYWTAQCLFEFNPNNFLFP